MRNTFKDATLEKEFQREGYVKVPFLEAEEVKMLKQAYFDSLKESGGKLGPEDERFQTSTEITYDFTFIDKNVAYKKKVFEIITRAFESKVNDLLDNYQAIIANYIHKETAGGEVPLHQNWAFVDEHECTSVSIWCPLVDSRRENGTLEVVPGSHKRFGEVRGPMIRSELLDIQEDIIAGYLKPMEVKAGEAVVLDDSIVHYSSPNKTEGLRLAIQLILIPKEVPSIHFHMDHAKSREQVEVLEVDHDFYMNFNPWKKPSEDITRLRSFQYQPFSLSINEFEASLYNKRFDEAQKTWWQKLLGR
jgi:hypothetical protein